jgi:hypothetical protein
MNKKKIIRVNESQLKNYIKKLINEEINNEETDEKEDFGVNALTGEPLPNPNDQIVHEEVGEKTKNTIDKWRSELGDMKTAVKLVDYMLGRMVGMSSSDLADTATFANGLEAIVEELESGDYKSALNLAGDTAKEMIDEEGFGDMFEGVNVSKTNKKDDWGRPIYKSEDGKKYVDISLGKSKKPELHSVTKEGEPDTPLKNFVIKEEESFMKMRAGAKGKVFENEDEFIPHGTYTLGNAGGYEIMLSDSGDSAKVRDAFGSDNPQTSDWLEIEYVYDEETGEQEPVIDPNGYDIPLNMVMRVNREGKVFENEGSEHEEMNQELNETIKRFKQIINY